MFVYSGQSWIPCYGWLPLWLLENGTVIHNSICCDGARQGPDCLLRNSRDYLPAIDFILPMGNLQFAVSSESERVPSSPHHSQSNGKVLLKQLSRMKKKKKKTTEKAQSDSKRYANQQWTQNTHLQRQERTDLCSCWYHLMWSQCCAASDEISQVDKSNTLWRLREGLEREMVSARLSSKILPVCWMEITKHTFGNYFRKRKYVFLHWKFIIAHRYKKVLWISLWQCY